MALRIETDHPNYRGENSIGSLNLVKKNGL